MKTWTLVITLALLLLSSCSGFRMDSPKVDSTPEKMDPEEIEQAKQEIYRVVASQYCGDGVVYIYPDVVRYPLYESEIEYAPQQLPEASPETWNSYRLVNDPGQQNTKFSDFPINCHYQFISPTQSVCAGADTGCIIPYGFSSIGFNEAGTQALVYAFKDCTECGGGGGIYLLERKEGSWTIINYVTLWVS